jgi:uncharacterized membrane protein YdjX (TVP38/TMEM64 family)
MARLKPLLLVAGVVGVVWLSHHYGLTARANVERIRALVESHAPYGPLVFIAICVGGIFLHVPEFLLIAAGGVIFEGQYAFAYGWIASLVGTTSTFLIVRYLARDYFQERLAHRFHGLRALDERLVRNGFSTVLSLRLLLFLAPPLNWALGATRVRVGHYVAGTALGVIPGIAASVFFADSIVNGRGGPARLLLPVAIVTALVLAARASRRKLDESPSRGT